MKMLCEECIDFLRIYLPENSFSTYSTGVCHGCYKKKETTNPKYWMKVIVENTAISVSNVTCESEKKAFV